MTTRSSVTTDCARRFRVYLSIVCQARAYLQLDCWEFAIAILHCPPSRPAGEFSPAGNLKGPDIKADYFVLRRDLLRSFSHAVAMEVNWLGETALSITIWPLNLRVETPKGAKGLVKGSSLEAT